MSATVHSLQPAATSPAASGPALREPAPFSNPLTDKCAWASQAALQAVQRVETAMYAAEYALDEVNRCARALDQARAQLSAAILEVRKSGRTINVMAQAFIDRMPKA